MPVPEASIKAVHVNAGPPWSSSPTSTSPLIIAATRSDAEGYFELLVLRGERSRVNCLFYDHSGKSGGSIVLLRQVTTLGPPLEEIHVGKAREK